MRFSRSLLLATPIVLLLAATPASAAVSHTVQPGETLWSIAAANNLTTRTVAAFNGLSEDAQVVLGSTINVPTVAEGASALAGSAAPQATAPAAAPSSAPAVLGSYVVRAGDTLGGLAANAGVSLDSMAAANGLDPSRPLLIGTVLKLPSGSPAPAVVDRPGAEAPAGPPGPGARLGAAAEPARGARRGATADPDPRRRRRHPVRGGAVRRLPLARVGDRVAGERLQQRHGVVR